MAEGTQPGPGQPDVAWAHSPLQRQAADHSTVWWSPAVHKQHSEPVAEGKNEDSGSHRGGVQFQQARGGGGGGSWACISQKS